MFALKLPLKLPTFSDCNSPGRKLLYLSSGDPPNDPNVPNVEEIKTFQRHN